MGTVHQHLAAIKAKAVLSKADQTVIPQKAQRSSIKQHFSPAAAGAEFLATVCGVFNGCFPPIDEYFSAIDDASDHGAVERS
ncbi:hypothetical protein [Synechococcus sp. GEYO]|uniref:hypothetical protein n=1 Tax=Synechococcus sp. GEYO TaxID=2575511 RepID=UPI001FCB9855|nr:hypothetical protein [Synechococcus sp. GEYO]